MDQKIAKEIRALLASGAINGVALQAERQFEGGVIAIRKIDGTRVLIPKAFIDLARIRNRGKD